MAIRLPQPDVPPDRPLTAMLDNPGALDFRSTTLGKLSPAIQIACRGNFFAPAAVLRPAL